MVCVPDGVLDAVDCAAHMTPKEQPERKNSEAFILTSISSRFFDGDVMVIGREVMCIDEHYVESI